MTNSEQGNDNIFNEAPQQQAEASDQQAPAEAPQVPEYLSGLVGEGKKYGSVENAMQSIPSAQDHIGRLEQENADLRSQLTDAENLRTLIDKNVQSQQAPETGVTAPAPDDIAALIDERMNARSAQEVATNNILQVDQAMKGKYGDQAQAMLSQKASELGVGVDFLQDTAGRSPKAFLQLFGMSDQTESVTPTSVQSSVNTEAMGNHNQGVKPGTRSYYDNLRKTNRSEYYNPRVQAQMAKDMVRDGFNS